MHVTVGLSSGEFLIVCFAISSPCGLSKSTPTSRASKGRVCWTTMEEAALIQLLFERRNELTFGPVFKEKDFRQVASVLKRLREKGVEKDVDSCKSKWRKVCMFFCTCSACVLTD